MHKAFLIIEGQSVLVGVFRSDSEAYIAGRMAWENWVSKNIPKEDRVYWTKEDSSDGEFGFGTSRLTVAN